MDTANAPRECIRKGGTVLVYIYICMIRTIIIITIIITIIIIVIILIVIIIVIIIHNGNINNIGGFLKWGVPQVIIHFRLGFSTKKTIQLLGGNGG